MKSEGGEKILEAIRQVLQGQVYVSTSMSAALLDLLTRPSFRDQGDAQAERAQRPRVRGVSIDRPGHCRPGEIGQRLNLSVKTVATHRQHITAETQAAHRAGADPAGRPLGRPAAIGLIPLQPLAE